MYAEIPFCERSQPQGEGRLRCEPLSAQSVHQGLGDYQMSGLVGVDRFWTEGVSVAVLKLLLKNVLQAH